MIDEKYLNERVKQLETRCMVPDISIDDELELIRLARLGLRSEEVLNYCKPHTDKMWAAKTISILLGCDFRDAKQTIETFFRKKGK